MDQQGTQIVFVTGASRSGTTMLCRVLGNHSQILGLRELHYFGDLCPATDAGQIKDTELERLAAGIFSRQSREVWGSGPTEAERARAERLCALLGPGERTAYGVFRAALASLAAESGKRLVCEQTPRNVFYAQDILTNLPGAKIVHIVRDPRAVLASQKNRWKLRFLGAGHVPVHEAIRTWVNYHPVTMAKLWVGATDAALRCSDDLRFKIVRFEDLLATPEQCVREICDFIDVTFERDMLLVPKWGSSNVKHESDDKGLSRDVLDQWETVVSAREIGIVEQIAGELMHRFSYEPRNPAGLSRLWGFPYNVTYPFHLLGVALTNPRRAVIQARAMLRRDRRPR